MTRLLKLSYESLTGLALKLKMVGIVYTERQDKSRGWYIRALDEKEANVRVVQAAMSPVERDFDRYQLSYEKTSAEIATFVDSLWKESQLPETELKRLTIDALALTNRLMPRQRLDPDQLFRKANEFIAAQAEKRKTI